MTVRSLCLIAPHTSQFGFLPGFTHARFREYARGSFLDKLVTAYNIIKSYKLKASDLAALDDR